MKNMPVTEVEKRSGSVFSGEQQQRERRKKKKGKIPKGRVWRCGLMRLLVVCM